MSAKDGALDAVWPVAAHMPGGGDASMSFILAVRILLETLEELVSDLWRVLDCVVAGLDACGLCIPSGCGKGTGVGMLPLESFGPAPGRESEPEFEGAMMLVGRGGEDCHQQQGTLVLYKKAPACSFALRRARLNVSAKCYATGCGASLGWILAFVVDYRDWGMCARHSGINLLCWHWQPDDETQEAKAIEGEA